MAEDTEQSDKTEEPTPRKREKAREEGQVARSKELTTFSMLVVGIGSLLLLAPMMADRFGSIMSQSFIFDQKLAMDSQSMYEHGTNMGWEAMLALAPFAVILVAVAILAPNALGGLLFSWKSIRPQASRLSIIKGLGRLVSAQALVELIKVIFKSILVGSALAGFIYFNVDHLVYMMFTSIKDGFPLAFSLAAKAAMVMAFSLVVVSLIDVPFQLFQNTKKLKMTREEVKKENKDMEGDPHIKARRRAQQRAMASRRIAEKVPMADVVITNPTHYAVALRYNRDKDPAPILVAKGVDSLAAKIKELAKDNDVPILEAPHVARSIYKHVDYDRPIPEGLYNAIAEVLAWALAFKEDRYIPQIKPDTLPVPEDLRVPERT